MTKAGQRWPAVAGLAALLAVVCLCACQTPAQKVAGFLSAGKKDLDNRNYANAILRFRLASRLAPKDAEPHFYLGLAYWAAGDLGQAGPELKAAILLNPNHVQAQIKLSELAVRFSEGGALLEAQRQVQQLLTQAPNDPNAWYTLAMAEWRLGKPEDALDHLRQALKNAPKHLESSTAMAMLQLERQDPAGAEKTMQVAASRAPQSVETWVAMGRFYLALGKAGEAETHLRRAIGMDPRNGPALMALGEAQIAMGDRQQAERTFARLSSLPDKQYKAAHAVFLVQERRYDAAIPELRLLAGKEPGDAALRGYLVAAYMGTGRLADAEKLLVAAVARDSGDLEAAQQYSQFLLRNSRIREAENSVASVARLHSGLAQAHVLLADVYEAKHAARSQQREFIEALRLNAGLLAARIRLARSLLSTRDPSSALAVVDQAPGAQKNAPSLQVERNWALLALRRFPELRQRLDAALAVSPTPELRLQDGLLKYQLGLPEAAAISFRQALQQDPEEVRALSTLARIYVEQKKPDEATAMVLEAAARFPNSPQLQVFAGGWMAAAGRLEQARKAFRLAKAADPQYVAADLGTARVAMMERKWDEARRILNPLCSGETAGAAHMLLANIAELAGPAADAVEHYRKVIEIEPGSAVALNNLAYLLADNPKRLDEGIEYANRAMVLAPSPGLHDTLGWLYYRKGLYRTAIQHLEQAVAAEGSARRRYHLAMAYFKMGDTRRGTTALNEALRVDPSLPEASVARELQAELPNRPASADPKQ